MTNFSKLLFLLTLAMESALQAKKATPPILNTIDGKQACPSGYEVAWPTIDQIEKDGAKSTCKPSSNASKNNDADYLAARLNNDTSGALIKQLLAEAKAGSKIDPNSSDYKSAKALKAVEAEVKPIQEATSGLNRYRQGLVNMLDGLSGNGLKTGKFNQKALSKLKIKIDKWNTAVKGSEFDPIYMCTKYGSNKKSK